MARQLVFLDKNWPLSTSMSTSSITIQQNTFMLLFFHIIQRVSILDAIDIHICKFDHFFFRKIAHCECGGWSSWTKIGHWVLLWVLVALQFRGMHLCCFVYISSKGWAYWTPMDAIGIHICMFDQFLKKKYPKNSPLWTRRLVFLDKNWPLSTSMSTSSITI